MDWREQVNNCEQKPQRKLPTYPPFSDTSSQGSCKQFPRDYYDVEPMKIKFICNFGGIFFPRPSDGELRYVGGDRRLIKISRDVSWQELICKTTRLIRRAHVIKYHLPGEQVNMLISITSDDDLRHMIDECIVLEKNEERLTMYLFSDNDDEHHVHFIVGSSSDTEKEAQFIALVNGLVRPGDELRMQNLGNSLANDLDQRMFDINEERLPAGRTEEASLYIKSKPSESITVPPKTSRGKLEKTCPSSQTRMTNKDYKAQTNEGNLIPAARNTRKAYLGSSVPSESTYIAKREQGGGHAASRNHPVLQQTATNMIGKSHQATGAQEKGSPGKQQLIPVDNSCVNMPSSNSNNNSPRRSVYEMPASLSRGSQKTANQHAGSDDNMMKSRRYSTQEEAMSHSAADPLRKNKNFQLHNKMEISEPSHESGTPMGCNDDMHISANLHTLEKSVATNSVQKQQPGVPVTCSNTSKKDHPSNPTSNSSEAVLSCSFTSSDKTTNLQPNILVRASSERQQERAGSPRPNEHSSKMPRSHSVGADNSSPQIRTPSQEAKDNAAPSISNVEVPETKNSEQALPANAMLGRDLTSNVQIISNEDLEDLREMGSGAFGTVFHGKWKGTDVAIKRIKNSCFMYPSSQADKLITEFWREAAILSKLHHPNILAFYGIVKNGPGGTLATVTEFMVNGSLKKVLLWKDKYLDWRKWIMLAMDAAIGMEYLHSKDIVHFDLKCDNLLVNIKDPSRPICKVADFGLSKMKQATLVSGGMRGTLPWMAPELLTMSSTKVSEKVDVYSFGVVMWEILTGEDPYDGMHYGGVIGGILSNTLRPPVPTSCNPEWRKLMEQCWSTEPERRPSFTEVATRLRAMLEASKSESLS